MQHIMKLNNFDEFINESKEPFADTVKAIQKGKKFWNEAKEKANKTSQKFFKRDANDDEIWEVVRKTFGMMEIVKIYKYLDYIREDDKYRYSDVESYLDYEKRGEVKHID